MGGSSTSRWLINIFHVKGNVSKIIYNALFLLNNVLGHLLDFADIDRQTELVLWPPNIFAAINESSSLGHVQKILSLDNIFTDKKANEETAREAKYEYVRKIYTNMHCIQNITLFSKEDKPSNLNGKCILTIDEQHLNEITTDIVDLVYQPVAQF